MIPANPASEVLKRALPAIARANGERPLPMGGPVRIPLIQRQRIGGNIVLEHAETGECIGQMANQAQADRTRAYFRP